MHLIVLGLIWLSITPLWAQDSGDLHIEDLERFVLDERLSGTSPFGEPWDDDTSDDERVAAVDDSDPATSMMLRDYQTRSNHGYRLGLYYRNIMIRLAQLAGNQIRLNPEVIRIMFQLQHLMGRLIFTFNPSQILQFMQSSGLMYNQQPSSGSDVSANGLFAFYIILLLDPELEESAKVRLRQLVGTEQIPSNWNASKIAEVRARYFAQLCEYYREFMDAIPSSQHALRVPILSAIVQGRPMPTDESRIYAQLDGYMAYVTGNLNLIMAITPNGVTTPSSTLLLGRP